MSTHEKVARWLAAWDGARSWDTLSNGVRIKYDDAADELLRTIYADSAQDAVAFDLDGDA